MPDNGHLPFKLIVSDLDGTLLDSDHRVGHLTAQVLDDLIARGVLFTVATGKTFPSTVRLIARFGIRVPVICSNGTLIHAPDGTVFHEDPIDLELALDAIDMALQANIRPIVYAGDGLVTDKWDDNVDVLRAHHEPDPVVVDDLFVSLRTTHKPHKLIFMNSVDPDAVVTFQHSLSEKYGDQAQVLRSGLDSVVELLPPGVTKGTALMVILDHLKIAPDDVIAFGDNCNDLDLIQRAAVGIAMGNSPQDVRDGADFVTRSNDEDGVGHALRRFLYDAPMPSG